jgi:hypothetical protein
MSKPPGQLDLFALFLAVVVVGGLLVFFVERLTDAICRHHPDDMICSVSE